MVGISLGWNCHSATKGCALGLRLRKKDGYNTCPFDEAITNYGGIVNCIRSDFADFFSLTLKEISKEADYCKGDLLIYNSHYQFLFNHESPGHANLWSTEGWPGGINHYVDNNYQAFIQRYTQRIANFREYLLSGEHITFLITHPSSDFTSLHEALHYMYPDLNYSIERFELEHGVGHYEAHMKLMKP
jgi:hypothetical protein